MAGSAVLNNVWQVSQGPHNITHDDMTIMTFGKGKLREIQGWNCLGHFGAFQNIGVKMDLKYALLASPINAHGGQKRSDNFDEMLQEKATLEKSLKEGYHSEECQQISFKSS